jgi:hypothetical protein
LKKAKEIFKLLNDFRRNPKLLAKHLEKLKTFLDLNLNVLSEPGKIQVQMVEGEAVFDEAINFLNKLKPLEELKWENDLFEAALEHVIDIGPKGLLSYQSSDGTEPEDRISKHGQYIESLGENIDFGPNDALGVIVSLTLDDGESERPHRENLFKDEYHKVGIACGPHSTEYQMCVMDFAFDFKPLNNNNKNNFLNEHSRTYEDNYDNFVTDNMQGVNKSVAINDTHGYTNNTNRSKYEDKTYSSKPGNTNANPHILPANSSNGNIFKNKKDNNRRYI